MDRTVSPDLNFESWSTQLNRIRLRTAISPLSGLTSPATIRSSVDLPEPFGPISPMRSCSETVKEMFWNRGLAPKAFEISCALMIGGNDLGSPGNEFWYLN